VIVKGVEWCRVSLACRLLGLSRQRVYQLIESGGLGSMVQDGVVWVQMASIEARMRLIQGRLEIDG